jgi:hypothetical protein
VIREGEEYSRDGALELRAGASIRREGSSVIREEDRPLEIEERSVGAVSREGLASLTDVRGDVREGMGPTVDPGRS